MRILRAKNGRSPANTASEKGKSIGLVNLISIEVYNGVETAMKIRGT
jgi:hypothetical protein